MMIAERIGYSLGPLVPAEQLLPFARAADATDNVDSIWVPESWGRESFVTLGALSQGTRNVRLGTSVVNIYSRSPATVAMAAATLDMLSSSRTVIGLGTSTKPLVENWHGMEFRNPVERMREFIECLHMILGGRKSNYEGNFFRVKDFKLLHEPPRKQIPIFMAAVNPRMISLASEIADGVLLYLRPLDELINIVAEIKRRTKNRPFEIACSFICAMSDEREKARLRAARTLAFYVAVGRYYNRFLSENGFRHEVDQISAEYRTNGAEAAARSVSSRMLDAITICGTPEECSQSLSRFLASGITLPIIQVNPVASAESSFREMLSVFLTCGK